MLRAVAIASLGKSITYTHTYFINKIPSNFPTVSISVSPSLLFGEQQGIMQKGFQPTSGWMQYGANFWKKKEIVPNVEIFERDGQCVYNNLSGLRIFGGMSRTFPQKSMVITARKQYGQKYIKHRLFGKAGLKHFKYIVLRNGGSDWGRSQFRDAFMTDLVADWDLEHQDKRPCHVYINGQYWGLYDLTEKINKRFIADHCDVDKDSIDLLEHRSTVKAGDNGEYIKMLKYIVDNDLSEEQHYAYIQNKIDIDNFINYQIAQIYFDNRDAGGNIRFWRPHRPSGKWRWILYDTDFGFGLNSAKAYQFNTLAFMTDANGGAWPNPSWSTFLLRNLLKNNNFKNKFITRFCDHLNSSFHESVTSACIEKHYHTLSDEIDRHLSRWRRTHKAWEKEVGIMRSFAAKRPAFMRQHLQNYFHLGDTLAITVAAQQGGRVRINELIAVDTTPFRGIYFKEATITITAQPLAGYTFVGWEGASIAASQKQQRRLSLALSEATNIYAKFQKATHPLAQQIVINEVACSNALTGDWVELYNASSETISLKNWILSDGKHEYTLPDTLLTAGNYITLAEDTALFKRIFPSATVLGNLSFNFSKKQENIMLYANNGAMIDSIGYRLAPTNASFSLSLKTPDLDNARLANWEVRIGNGTPNSANAFIVESSTVAERIWWMRLGCGIALLLILALLLGIKKFR